MPGCCNARGCDRMFGRRFADHVAGSYRRRGLRGPGARIVDLVSQRGIAGATILEIGGGVGEIQVELLKRGASRTTNLELSPAYETPAQRLLDEVGLSERADRRLVDLAEDPDAVEPHDIVVLNRVVCCYPDYARLLGAVAGRARRLVAFSYPPRNVVSRGFIGVQNTFFAVRGSEFRIFAHPPEAMFGVLAENGLRRTATATSGVWRIAVVTR